MGLIVVLAFVALDIGVIVVVFVVVVFVSAPMATIVIAAHATAIIGIIFVIDLKNNKPYSDITCSVFMCLLCY